MREIVTSQEKGIDLRIGLDVVRMAHLGQVDVALIFSQDQDLAEVADEIREISHSENRWLKVASAFPVSPLVPEPRESIKLIGSRWPKHSTTLALTHGINRPGR